MKLIHIADLHFGKKLHGVSLDEQEQPAWMESFLSLVETEKPDAVLIAGDVYDRSTPSGEAVQLLDDFLTALTRKNVSVMVVAGNHDSGQRISFANRLLADNRLYISGVPEKEMAHVTLTDEYGEVTFWLMPYIIPGMVRDMFGDDSVHDFDAAVRRYIAEQNIDMTKRNVIIAHQNVLRNGEEGIRGGSETMIGGVGGVEYTAFDGFDYVALGHIHAAQKIGRDEVRYAGSPLCYHFSELRHSKKGPVVVTLKEKGVKPEIEIRQIAPLHPLREVEGTVAEIIAAERNDPRRGEYIRVVTKGHVEPMDFENINNIFAQKDSLVLDYGRAEVEAFAGGDGITVRERNEKNILELFEDFAMQWKSCTLDEKELATVRYVAQHTANGVGNAQPSDADVDALIDFMMEMED